MDKCQHLGEIHATTARKDGTPIEVRNCAKLGICTETDHGLVGASGPLPVCSGCPFFPKVSAICLTHDFPRRLPALNEAVESFHRQTYGNRELIIVNDTPGVTLEYEHPLVRILNLPERFATLGDKRNAGVDAASGGIICVWDDDDISLPHRMQQAVDRISGGYDYFDPAGAWHHVVGQNDWKYWIRSNNIFSTGAFLRSAWERVGKYAAKNGNEDGDLHSKLMNLRVNHCGTKEDCAYIYHWDDGQHHVSGNGELEKNYQEGVTYSTTGTYKINPSWKMDYQAKINSLNYPPVYAGNGMSKFCYYTGTNQISSLPIVESMIYSARKSGIQEDIRVFSPGECREGAINHHWPANVPWLHMHKLTMLRDHLASLDYEYFVWLDSDTWFLKNPDLSGLIRSNAFWIQGESEATDTAKIRRGDWWGCPISNLESEFRRWGIGHNRLWTTNGGMWIVRKEAIKEVCEKAFEVNDFCVKNIHPTSCDETALAICGHLFVEDPDLNRKELNGHIWFCDWMGRWTDVEPRSGVPVVAEDWLTGQTWGPVEPAIVHAMRAKTWMKNRAGEWRPGDDLEAALNFVGITKQRVSAWLGKPCKCPAYQQKINKVGAWVQGLIAGKPRDTAKQELENMLK